MKVVVVTETVVAMTEAVAMVKVAVWRVEAESVTYLSPSFPIYPVDW